MSPTFDAQFEIVTETTAAQTWKTLGAHLMSESLSLPHVESLRKWIQALVRPKNEQIASHHSTFASKRVRAILAFLCRLLGLIDSAKASDHQHSVHTRCYLDLIVIESVKLEKPFLMQKFRYTRSPAILKAGGGVKKGPSTPLAISR